MIPDALIQAIAQAIATAEGFFVAGALPARANNPGNLKMGNVGLGTIGGKTVYPSAEAGWGALHRQVSLMLTGQSAYYKPSMTIAQVAAIYTGGDNAAAWARIVAARLGTTVDATLTQLLGRGPERTQNTLLIAALVALGGALVLSMTD